MVTQPKMIKIVLVDDHVLVRAGIRSLIERLEGFSVVAEASNPVTATVMVAQFLPDVMVTDIAMGNFNGLDSALELKIAYPNMAVIILSMHTSEAFISTALQNGASAYLLKDAAPTELEIALRAVVSGETYLSPAVSTKLISRLHIIGKPLLNPIQSLTGRQLQILEMIANSLGTKEIAFQLDLSEKTVAAHRSQMMERIGARNMVELTLFAIKNGLLKSSV